MDPARRCECECAQPYLDEDGDWMCFKCGRSIGDVSQAVPIMEVAFTVKELRDRRLSTERCSRWRKANRERANEISRDSKRRARARLAKVGRTTRGKLGESPPNGSSYTA